MKLPDDQRQALAAFLRARRSALDPVAAGIPTGRRRTPGLRREEVAQRASLSTTWYTWVEQARDIVLSEPALSRLATALNLTAAERAYLFQLAQRHDPAPPDSAASLPLSLAAALQTIAAPAYLLDRLWRACGWNDRALQLFPDWLGAADTSLLGYIFRHPAAPDFICDWEDRARRVLAEFRADTARNPNDAALQSLIAEFRRDSPSFARLWHDHAVLGREGGLRCFDHPQHGPLSYEQITLIPAGHPDLKLVMLLPA